MNSEAARSGWRTTMLCNQGIEPLKPYGHGLLLKKMGLELDNDIDEDEDYQVGGGSDTM